MPLLRKMQSNGRGPKVRSFSKSIGKNSNDTPIDSLEKLSNFCEDTSWLSIIVWEWYPKNF